MAGHCESIPNIYNSNPCHGPYRQLSFGGVDGCSDHLQESIVLIAGVGCLRIYICISSLLPARYGQEGYSLNTNLGDKFERLVILILATSGNRGWVSQCAISCAALFNYA